MQNHGKEYFDVSNCRYEVVRQVAQEKNYKLTRRGIRLSKKCIIWLDTATLSFKLLGALKGTHKLNHFPGMSQICQKSRLARTLYRLNRKIKSEFNFFPKTFCLPEEVNSLISWFNKLSRRGKMTLIIKPSAGSRGVGIFLSKDLDFLEENELIASGEPFVVQKYIKNPLLLSGLKFDLRLYVLVTSCSPELECFLYNEGLARFCTENFEASEAEDELNIFRHLTNYALSKQTAKFEGDIYQYKMLLSKLFSKLEVFYEQTDIQELWKEIKYIITKTLLSIQNSLENEYIAWFGAKSKQDFSCFEILGFDLLIDENLKPWLIEVNCSPSLHTETDIDQALKHGLISETIEKCGFSHVGNQPMKNYNSNFEKLHPVPERFQVEKKEVLQRILNFHHPLYNFARKQRNRSKGLEVKKSNRKPRWSSVVRGSCEELNLNDFGLHDANVRRRSFAEQMETSYRLMKGRMKNKPQSDVLTSKQKKKIQIRPSRNKHLIYPVRRKQVFLNLDETITIPASFRSAPSSDVKRHKNRLKTTPRQNLPNSSHSTLKPTGNEMHQPIRYFSHLESSFN
eukprot:snap_masked-scaffold_2-processed-gene-5.23-mRNA-1 protein AED:0.23 eAED:0.23 QI:0/-1/0/1/-1/1/1/0/567